MFWTENASILHYLLNGYATLTYEKITIRAFVLEYRLFLLAFIAILLPECWLSRNPNPFKVDGAKSPVHKMSIIEWNALSAHLVETLVKRALPFYPRICHVMGTPALVGHLISLGMKWGVFVQSTHFGITIELLLRLKNLITILVI